MDASATTSETEEEVGVDNSSVPDEIGADELERKRRKQAEESIPRLVKFGHLIVSLYYLELVVMAGRLNAD